MFLWKREPICFCDSRNSRSASGKSNGTWLKNSTLPRSNWSQCHGAWVKSYLLTSTIAELPDTAVINILQSSFEEIIRGSFLLRKMTERNEDRGANRIVRALSPVYLSPFWQRAPLVIEVSSPAEAVIWRLKQPLTELLEKKSCVFCWPVLPVMLKLESKSNVSLGVTVLDTTLNESGPLSPWCTAALWNCWRIVVVCWPEPSGLMEKVKPRSSGHSKRCWLLPPPWPSVCVSEEMVVRCLMFCTKAVLVMLNSCRLEN